MNAVSPRKKIPRPMPTRSHSQEEHDTDDEHDRRAPRIRARRTAGSDGRARPCRRARRGARRGRAGSCRAARRSGSGSGPVERVAAQALEHELGADQAHRQADPRDRRAAGVVEAARPSSRRCRARKNALCLSVCAGPRALPRHALRSAAKSPGPTVRRTTMRSARSGMPAQSAICSMTRSASASTAASPSPSMPPRPMLGSAGIGTSTKRFSCPSGATSDRSRSACRCRATPGRGRATGRRRCRRSSSPSPR